ncbi:MAG: alpha/beta hydrolase family protein [Salinigranum sp.]
MSEQTPSRRGGWSHRGGDPVGPLDRATEVDVPTDGPPIELHEVFTDDGLYLPALVRTPPGPGPFPTVVCLHGGSGGLGVRWLVDFATNRGALFERLLAEGYAVCVTEGRRENEGAYGTDPDGVLDHEDVIGVYRYLRRQAFVDRRRIGFFGASHGGELQLKLAAEVETPPAALTAFEPAGIEFLGLRFDGPRVESNLQFRDPLDDDQIDLEAAVERIDRIDDDLPILVGGRDDDHLQGLFRKCYELLDRRGKSVEWVSFDHPEHAYQWGPRRTRGVGDPGDGGSPTYDLGPVEAETIDTAVGFLNEHVRDR